MLWRSFSFARQPLWAALLLAGAGCAGNAAPAAPSPATLLQADATPSALAPAIVVGNYSGANILKFALDAKGNVSPTAVISGPRTGIEHADNVALDTSFRTYASINGKTIAAYSADAHGNAKPVRTIAGGNTQLAFPIGVAVDSAGYLYVADCGYGNVKVYAPGANGNVSPIRVIGLTSGCTIQLAVDKTDQLYVTSGDNLISEFSSESNGNALLRTISEGKGSGGIGIRSIAVDGRGYVYAGNLLAKDIRVFAPHAQGFAKPMRTIGGSNTHLGAATGLALDASNNLYATICRHCSQGSGTDSILVFGPGAKGNVKPDRVIEGKNTMLSSPTDLVVRQ
ncbi:MAG: hypothetical protein WCD38_12690 [Candidatus Tumulicola sp.]